MGFNLHKSIKVGPLRFNLSQSGVGVSVGAKGLRFGTGPRGNYVHIGRKGVCYRATLPPSGKKRQPPQPFEHLSNPFIPDNTHAPLEEIESEDVAQIVDSSSKELLEEINYKNKKIRLHPWAIGGFILLLVGYSWPDWLIAPMFVIGCIAIYMVYSYDALSKTVVLFYDFDEDVQKAYLNFHEAISGLTSCAKIWHIEASGRVYDKKYHAGASNLIQRKVSFIRKMKPPYIKSNIETFAIGVGKQTLHFFPDRVLIYDKNRVGAVGYQELKVDVSATRFVEDETVPRDAKVVGHTWQYVNKSGGPDKRFKNNRVIPICIYDEISLSSASGLNEVIQVSRVNVALSFAQAIRNLGVFSIRSSEAKKKFSDSKNMQAI